MNKTNLPLVIFWIGYGYTARRRSLETLIDPEYGEWRETVVGEIFDEEGRVVYHVNRASRVVSKSLEVTDVSAVVVWPSFAFVPLDRIS